MTEVLPATRIVRVVFEIALPAAANREQIEEWILFGLGGGSMGPNPLQNHEVEALSDLTLTDTGRHVRFRITEVEKTDTGHRWRSLTCSDDTPGEFSNQWDAARAAIDAVKE